MGLFFFHSQLASGAPLSFLIRTTAFGSRDSPVIGGLFLDHSHRWSGLPRVRVVKRTKAETGVPRLPQRGAKKKKKNQLRRGHG